MALTATAQSALPTWDETIVPALRKRLESESRILAKRMSVASISSADDSQRSSAPSHSRRSSRDISHTPRHIPEPRKSSAIPRPSLHYSRPPQDPSSSTTRLNGASSSPVFTPKRARTYSQPPSPPNAFVTNPLPTPESSRPTSPRTSDVKPTRIPIAARTRTTSSSSHAHSIAQRADSRTGNNHRPYQLPTPDNSQDHWVVKANAPPKPSTPPMASIRHQRSSIMNEPPPFPIPSITSFIRTRTQEPLPLDPRPSNDSEERPFEHWYRGDIHRNGGVGELRVAKHVEMLQIANYGHSLRRGGLSVTGTRESLYLDEDPTEDVGMVLDESPPTDIEAGHDSDPETFYDAYASADAEVDADETIHSKISASTVVPPHAAVSFSRSQTPTIAHPVPESSATPKRATHVQTASDPPRSSVSSAPLRTSTESAMRTPGPRQRTVSRTTRATSPISQSSDQSHTKRRAKSPAATSLASTPKKPKVKVKTPPSATKQNDPRNFVATYPTPEGDAVDAIPTWTQPVQKAGNWDEVVLPVVARKKGLDEQYEQADGSPKPRTEESPVKPAPGTFGFDYTKYRPATVDEEMELREFGHLPDPALLP
ncbi:hypothetical protein JVU11DRAFT_3327 [Chiua virens]|nr:hypothetical protein JVU11DRAFT_3327 [Chiua virens]